MKRVILTFEMNDEFVGMHLTHEDNNPTKEEEIVTNQMINHILNGEIRSPKVASASGDNLEEVKEAVKIEKDIYRAGQ